LALAPPSTRSFSNFCRLDFAIAAMTSAVECAIASSAARAKCAFVVPRVNPTMVPRAFGCHDGAPRPTSAGTK
jgi:hypothetical protein